MDNIALASHTMFAELIQRALDADFDETFREQGNFKRRKREGRWYWYYVRDINGTKRETYVGPMTDKAVTDRVNRFADIKSDFKQRREMVRALIAAGLPRPDPISGAVIEAMWKAGFFRLRGVLVGSLAYQCYAGLLGIRLPAASLHTDDVDFAQFWGISENIGESMAPPIDVLRKVDPTFTEVPRIDDPFVTTQYRAKSGYKVEFLTPNRGSDEHQGKPARMKALAGSGAQPLRHLDYLLHQPERSVLLYAGGLPVTVPRAERFAIHKLIVAVERQNAAKSEKDIAQAGALIMALANKRPIELGEAWHEARSIGPKWRDKLEAGAARLPFMTPGVLKAAVELYERRIARNRRT